MKHVNIDRKLRRKKRVSGNIFGTSTKPRINVYRSSQFIYAQAIDDQSRKTLASFSSLLYKKEKDYKKMKKVDEAKQIGIRLAKLMIEKKITQGVFDRSVYTYLGRVKSLCEGLREGGIKI
jgi:large subunit ribosomal protein L18